jgi:osmotically-inducible protein OsmY
MADEYLAEHVRDALAHDPRVADLDISVTMEPGGVRLSGQVTTEERREAVSVVAREMLHDHDVRNEITVSVCDEPVGVENLP